MHKSGLSGKYLHHYFNQLATLIYLRSLLVEVRSSEFTVLKGNLVTSPIMYILILSHYYLFPKCLSLNSVLSPALARGSLIICTVTLFRLQGISFRWPLSIVGWRTIMNCPTMWLGKRAWALEHLSPWLERVLCHRPNV